MNRAWLIGCGAFLGIIVIIALIFGGIFVRNYNQIIELDNDVEAAWAQVENQLQRRYELIPNLVETVKGFATQEKEIFTNIANARARIGSSQTPEQRIEAEQEMSGFLSRLLMIVENYPQLKSDASFLNLQAQLEGTENRIAVERQRYNEKVQAYNLYIRRVPGRFYASIAGYEPRPFFEAAESAQTAPRVDFSTPPGQNNPPSEQ